MLFAEEQTTQIIYPTKKSVYRYKLKSDSTSVLFDYNTQYFYVGRKYNPIDTNRKEEIYRTILRMNLGLIPDSAVITQVNIGFTFSVVSPDIHFTYKLSSFSYGTSGAENEWKGCDNSSTTVYRSSLQTSNPSSINFYYTNPADTLMLVAMENALSSDNFAICLQSYSEDANLRIAELTIASVSITYSIPTIKVSNSFGSGTVKINGTNYPSGIELKTKVGRQLTVQAENQLLNGSLKYFLNWQNSGQANLTNPFTLQVKKPRAYSLDEYTAVFGDPISQGINNTFYGGVIKLNGDIVPVGNYPLAPNVAVTLGSVKQDFDGYERVWNNYSELNKSQWIKRDIHTNQYLYIYNAFDPNYSFTTNYNDSIYIYLCDMKRNFNISRNDVFPETGLDSLTNRAAMIVESNAGNLTAPASRSKSNLSYQFWQWSDGVGANSRTVTPTDNGTYTAQYKAIQRSNDVGTYANNSSRKIVRISSGDLIMIYRSMDRIWYEQSTNNGTTWTVMNNGKPISTGNGKSPAITAVNGTVLLAWHEITNVNKIHLQFRSTGDGSLYLDTAIVNSVPDYTKEIDLAVNWSETKIIAVWRNPISSTTSLLAFALFQLGNGFIMHQEGNIPGSGSNDVTPTVSLASPYYSQRIHVAWKRNGTGTSSIYYSTSAITYNNGVYSTSFSTPNEISVSSGYNLNYNPSIVSFQNGARVCWIGYRETGTLENGTLVVEQNTLFKDPTYWRIWSFGSNVNSPSIGNNADISYLFAWTENNSAVKFTDNSLSPARTVTGKTGKDVQVTNGTAGYTFSDTYASVYNVSTAPYVFTTTGNMQSYYGQGKAMQGAIGFGREGVMSKDSAQFYFCVGDVTVSGSKLEFVEIPADAKLNSLTDLNGYTRTKSFTINSNTMLNYSVLYGTSNAANAAAVLGTEGTVNFKMQLIEEATGNVLGTFDEVTYNSNNTGKYANISYAVNIEGNDGKTVYLALKVASSINTTLSIVDKLADGLLLAKATSKKINLSTKEIITTYALDQNYPNPFNPATTINYQLPKAGIVTLKIYDMLGKEVKVLVNEYKESGKYTAEFNGAGLASGVYIYRLDCNDFHATKKLTLLK